MSRVFKPESPSLYLGLVAVYFIVGKLGLKLAFLNASASAVWPCTGIALAALLICGYRLWPAIFAGAFLVNLTTAGTILSSLSMATGNTLEAVIGCYLVTRFADNGKAFQRSQNIFKFVLLAGMVGTAVSASIGTATLVLAHLAEPSRYLSIWLTWWLGDGVGALVITPLLLLWAENPSRNWTRQQIIELAFLFFGLISTTWFVFGYGFHNVVKDYPFEYLSFPFLVWAAFRFGRRKAATAIFVLAIVATWGTVHGYGPFVRISQNTSLLLLQSFMAIVAVTTMVLAAESTAHKHAEEHVRQLADSDPLTGLANYRRLVEALDSEIKRYGRSQSPFAIVLLDLDHLKKINDTYGHLVGSRALCRLANILRLHSREIDVAARYGGDEFVLLLPETNTRSALFVAQRIAERLRNESEHPPLSVSTGVALYPFDGQNLDELLVAADRAMYAEKTASKSKLHLPL
jgi:diguanylate cyclase (GGDEF)-like protein